MNKLQPTELNYFQSLQEVFTELELESPKDHYVIALPKAIRNRFLTYLLEDKKWQTEKIYGNNLHPFKNSWISLTDFSVDAFKIPDTDYNKFESDSVYKFYSKKEFP